MKERRLAGEPLDILLVEDNEDHAELVIRSLKEHRVVNRIKLVTDGEEALNYLNRRGAYITSDSSPRPHVILLDLRLPRIDGLEVLRTIKTSSELSSIPVVVLTTSEAERDVARAYEYHANSYVLKPVGFKEFHQLLRDLGFYWLAWNHCPDELLESQES